MYRSRGLGYARAVHPGLPDQNADGPGGPEAIARPRTRPRTHASVGLIGSSEDMLQVDFTDGKISRVGDQFGLRILVLAVNGIAN
jgi:hypothetical protein